jgi:4-hydroxybenzoate polyprenyltransferase
MLFWNIFKLFRFKNLLIASGTQYLFQYLILLPAFQKEAITPVLSHFLFLLFVLTTVILAASGYVINDLLDYKTDLLNKPHKTLINKHISAKAGWFIYIALFVFGFLINLSIFLEIKDFWLLAEYSVFFLALAIYSIALKQRALIGNLVIAIFCALVPLIVLFAERHSFGLLIDRNPGEAAFIFRLFAWYASFAFLTTMIREVIKDIEDFSGDVATNCRTFPVLAGITASKWLVAFLAILLLPAVGLFSVWLYKNDEPGPAWMLQLGIFLPLFHILYKLKLAKLKSDYTQLSMFVKMLMVIGLMILIVICMF